MRVPSVNFNPRESQPRSDIEEDPTLFSHSVTFLSSSIVAAASVSVFSLVSPLRSSSMFAKFLLLLNCVALARAVQYTVSQSEIKEVLIGGSISEVSRSFTLESIPKGFHTIIVNHVPSSVDEKSIQVAGTGAAEVVSTLLHKQVV